VIEDHLTLGFTMAMSKTSEISFNYVKSFENSVTGPFSSTMEQDFFEFGYASHF